MADGDVIAAVVVTTMDRGHAEPAIVALEAVHHLLLEKPMVPTWDECQRIAAAPGVTAVCHSMRYARPFRLLKDAVHSGR